MRTILSTIRPLRRLTGVLIFSAAVSGAVYAQSGNAPTSAMAGMTMGQITFSVQDLDLVSDWYVKMLGFKVVQTSTPHEGFTFRTISIPGFSIDLVKQTGSSTATWPYSRYMQQGYVHYAFYVNDVTSALKELQAKKADVTPLTGGDGQINRLILHDPEGNEFELFLPPKR